MLRHGDDVGVVNTKYFIDIAHVNPMVLCTS